MEQKAVLQKNGHIIAKVYVEQAVYHIDKAFDYLVPDSLEVPKKGCRVLVPFGRSNKKIQGIVYGIESATSVNAQLKPVFSVIDKEPIVSGQMFEMIEFLVSNTFCTYYDAVKCVLPIGENVSVIERYRVKEYADGKAIPELTEEQRRVVDFLKAVPTSKKNSYKTLRDINIFFSDEGKTKGSDIVKKLISLGLVERVEEGQSRVAKKTVRMARISEGVDISSLKLSAKQNEVLQMLSKVSMAMIKELAYLCGVTEGVVKALEKKGVITFFEREVEPLYGDVEVSFESLENVELSAEQSEAFESLYQLTLSNKPNAALLYGVTGSGKTQVYVKLIESVLRQGKTAMLLVPEIALTPQLLAKFNSLFGETIAVLHSALSASERLISYNKIKAGQLKIVIGTRSAVFAPLENLGVIILDEEGEASYKSESPPRYHARDIAKLRCVKNNALLLLASATPSIDSYYNAICGKYKLFILTKRYASANLPSVYIVDMLEEEKQKNYSPISEVLAQQLAQNLKKGEQSILLINRRGYHTVASCMSCGEVVKCKNCDVSLTFHKANGYMMCHHCGHTERLVTICQSCGGKYIKLTGLGTQKLEDELLSLFPDARLLRMDADTTYSKFSYEKSFSDFKAHKYDIMLGTQMIAKGLDFPDVTLVGVLNADSGLYSADFKASERIFSLITQVVGRSGRSEKKGRAYIQTLDTQNPIINFAANQDYNAFYEDEMFTRKEMNLPPFCDIVTLGFSGEIDEVTKTAAEKALFILKEQTVGKSKVVMQAYGVSKATIFKVSNKYRYRILIKCRMNTAMKEVISSTLINCGRDKLFSKISCFADVNGDVM